MRVEKIPNTSLGARVYDLDINMLSDDEFDEIRRHFLDHGLLVFPGQTQLTPDNQAAFARRFHSQGTLEFDRAAISNQKRDGSVLDDQSHAFQILRGNEHWHTDSTYMPLSSKAAMLYAVGPLPSAGGGTGFADQRAGWDALDR